ncbi:hypothetical protein Scep_010199 [Stephania cephalantha]|uniref:Uncharacterized protein n=1 Tax=Stephania cephalantha TaxID=152367 RepID=A0AAP0JUK1_9MAGN
MEDYTVSKILQAGTTDKNHLNEEENVDIKTNEEGDVDMEIKKKKSGADFEKSQRKKQKKIAI